MCWEVFVGKRSLCIYTWSWTFELNLVACQDHATRDFQKLLVRQGGWSILRRRRRLKMNRVVNKMERIAITLSKGHT